MSLINKMLQELEARQSTTELRGLPGGQAKAAPEVPPLRRGRWAMAATGLAIAAAAWGLGRHMGAADGEETAALAPDAAREAAAASVTEEPASAMTAGKDGQARLPSREEDGQEAGEEEGPGGVPEASAPAPLAANAAAPDRQAGSRPAPPLAEDTATQAVRPPSPALDAGRADTVETVAPGKERAAAAAPRPAAAAVASLAPDSPAVDAPGVAPARSGHATHSAGEGGTDAFALPANVSKEVTSATPRHQAEQDFRRATVLIQEGRRDAAALALEQALKLDAGHAAARQTLVGLLLERQEQQQAMQLLREGLALDRQQAGLAMMLARLQMEQGALPAAIQTLQDSQRAARRPDYPAFLAALYQRAGRHQEAVEAYRAALAQAPQQGLWWLGMGISLRDSARPAQAREAFLRAQDSEALTPPLRAFVQQELAKLP